MNVKLLAASLLATSLALPAAAAQKIAATPFSTWETLSGRDAAKIADGDLNTYFKAKQSAYAWVALDLGEPHVISSIKYAPVSSSSMILGMFQGANNADFSDAIPLQLITVTPNQGQFSEVPVTCSRGVRYIRYVGPENAGSAIAEMEVYGDKGAGDDNNLWQLTNLPTIVINTVDSEEPWHEDRDPNKEHSIVCTIISIAENEGKSKILCEPGTIKERGNGSRTFPKRPFQLKFDKKQTILPNAEAKAKKWTLINNYGDKTLMRNILAFETARALEMEYVPYCQAVDVVLNGEYKGCYQLCDQVEVNKNRVNVEEMEPTDIDGENLTGGYLCEVDAYADQEISWFTTSHYQMPVTIKYPKDDEIVSQQKKYINDYFNMVENSLKLPNGETAIDPVTGYRRVFDTRSFLKHMLVNEVAANTDTYWSTYMYKRRNDPKLYTGPVWDFDLGFNNDYRIYPVQNRTRNNWLWNSGNGVSAANGMLWFVQRVVTKDANSKEEIKDIWNRARHNGLSIEWFNGLIDQYAAYLDQSQKLNFMRWTILNQQVHMNPQAAGSYAGEVKILKDYIKANLPNIDKLAGYEENWTDPTGIELPSVSGDAVTAIYSLDGRLVRSGSEVSAAGLTPGLYIVKQGSQTRKILVR